MKRLLSIAALVAVALCAVITGSAMAGAGSPVKASVVYNSLIPNGPPANLPSPGVTVPDEIVYVSPTTRATSATTRSARWRAMRRRQAVRTTR